MSNKLNKKGGAVLFLCIIIAAIILIQSILYSGVLRRQQEVELRRSMQIQVDQILSKYDDMLFRNYGIMALNSDSIDNSHHVYNYTNRFAHDASVESTYYEELTTEDIERIITSYMRMRYPTLLATDIAGRVGFLFEDINFTAFLNEMGNNNVVGYIEPLMRVFSSVDKYLDVFDAVEEYTDLPIIADYIDDIKGFLDDFRFVVQRQTTSVFQAGDHESIMLNFYDPKSIQYVAGASEIFIDGDSNFIMTHIYINRYITGHFNSAIQQEYTNGQWRDESNIYGTPYSEFVSDNYPYLEYILTGVEDPNVNRLICRGIVFSIRATINILLSISDPEKNSTATVLSESIVAAIAVASGGSFSIPSAVIKYIILVTWALIDTMQEVDILMNGGSVPLIQNRYVSEFDKLEDILSTSYRDYMGYYLLFIPTSMLSDRIRISLVRISGQSELYKGVRMTAHYRGNNFEVVNHYDMYK